MFVVGLGACATAEIPGGGVDANNQTRHAHNDASAGHITDGSGPTGDDAGSSADCSASGVLATWSFTAETGSQASTSVATASGVTGGDFSRGPGLTATSGAGSINASKWSTSAQLDETTYYTVSITPPSNCALTLTGIAIDVRASGTGPTMAAVGTDDDGFATTSPVDTTAPSTATLSVVGTTNPVELRIFGYGATSASGTMRVQNTLTVSGMLQ